MYPQICRYLYKIFNSVQLFIRVQLFVTPWTTACQTSLIITNSQSLLKLMSIKSVMPSNYLALCCPLLLQPSILSSIRVFSNEVALYIRWPVTQERVGVSTSASVLPMNMQDWFPLGWAGWISLQSKGLSRSSPTPQFKSINSLGLTFLHGPTLTSIHDCWKNHGSVRCRIVYCVYMHFSIYINSIGLWTTYFPFFSWVLCIQVWSLSLWVHRFCTVAIAWYFIICSPCCAELFPLWHVGWHKRYVLSICICVFLWIHAKTFFWNHPQVGFWVSTSLHTNHLSKPCPVALLGDWPVSIPTSRLGGFLESHIQPIC